MKNKLTITTLAALAGLAGAANAQALYTENFTGENGKGYVGGAPATSDFTGVDWTITGDTTGLTATSDFFVVSSEVMEMQDLDGFLTWESPSFSLAGNTSVNFSIDLGASGDFEASGDIFNVKYSIDGGSLVDIFTGVVDEVAPGDPMFIGSTELTASVATFTATLSSLTGSNMQIFVEAENNAGSESYFFDNVTATAVPEPGSFALLAGSLGMVFVMLKRRRA